MKPFMSSSHSVRCRIAVAAVVSAMGLWDGQRTCSGQVFPSPSIGEKENKANVVDQGNAGQAIPPSSGTGIQQQTDGANPLSPPVAETAKLTIDPTGSSDAPSATPAAGKPKRDFKFKIFSLKNGNATDYVELLKTFYRSARIAADPRTNSVLIESSQDDLQEIEAILQRLDESDAAPQAGRVYSGNSIVTFTTNPPSPNPSQLNTAIMEHESKAKLLADGLRKQSAKTGQGSDADKVHQELAKTLTETLELKFKQEQQQLEQLEKRLGQLRRQHEFRRAHASIIVERRAQELMEGDSFRWAEPDPETEAKSNASPSKAFAKVKLSPVSPNPASHSAASNPFFNRIADAMPPSADPTEMTPVDFVSPANMEITTSGQRKQVAPCRFLFRRDKGHTERSVLQLTRIPGVEWGRFAVLLDTYPCDDKGAKHLDAHAVPVVISLDDFQSAAEGRVVTKFVLLKEQPGQGLAYLTRPLVAGRDSTNDIDSDGKTVLAIQLARDFAQLGVEEPKPLSMPRNGFGPPQSSGLMPGLMINGEPLSDVSLFRTRTSQLAAINRAVADAQDKIQIAQAMADAARGSALEVSKARREYEEAILNQKLLNDEYQEMLRDLDLQVRSAQVVAENAKKTYDRFAAIPPGAISVHEIDEARTKLDQATIALQRLQLRQELYQKAAVDLKAVGTAKPETPAADPVTKPPANSASEKPKPQGF